MFIFRIIIKVFNIIIINRNKVFRFFYIRLLFRFTDYKKALKYIKAIKKKLKIDILERKTLTELEFTFYKSGILINKNYIKELFFIFADKFKN